MKSVFELRGLFLMLEIVTEPVINSEAILLTFFSPIQGFDKRLILSK